MLVKMDTPWHSLPSPLHLLPPPLPAAEHSFTGSSNYRTEVKSFSFEFLAELWFKLEGKENSSNKIRAARQGGSSKSGIPREVGSGGREVLAAPAPNNARSQKVLFSKKLRLNW